MANYRIISSDSHIVEPADLWTKRADKKYKDRVPHVVSQEDGDWWYTDGLKGQSFGAGTGDGARFTDPDKLSYRDRVENVRPGAYLPEEHVKDMDIDGIDMGLIYPTHGLLIFFVPDSDLLTHSFTIYNNWIAEFCAAFPKRLRGIGMVNVDDIQSGIREMERCARMGLAGVMISAYPPEDRSYDLPEYEPLWAAAEDLRIPLSLHAGTNRPGPGAEFVHLEDVRPSVVSNVDHWVRMSLGHMIFSGVFERYPKLQVGAVEMELSWVPHFMDRMDYAYTQRPHGDRWYTFKEDALPSDYFHHNVFLGFQEDAVGIRLRDIIGVDNLQWGSDYPHMESTFPRSREILDELLADCSEEEKVKIVGGNTARVYGLD